MNDKQKADFQKLMYGLIKNAARSSFVEFLDEWGLTMDDYSSIKGAIELSDLDVDTSKFYL